MDQNKPYCADSRRVLRCASFWIDSTKSEDCVLLSSEVLPKGCVCAGRRARESEKAGDGKTVSAFARMLVVVSVWRRWGLNW